MSKQLQNNIDLANNIINDNNEKNKILENRIINKEEKCEESIKKKLMVRIKKKSSR